MSVNLLLFVTSFMNSPLVISGSNLQDGENVSVSASARSICVAKHLVLVEDVQGIVGQTSQYVNHEARTKIIPSNFLLKFNKTGVHYINNIRSEIEDKFSVFRKFLKIFHVVLLSNF